MLSTVPYSEISGQRFVEFDAVLLTPNFMKMWAQVPHVVKEMCGSTQTKEKLPDEKIQKLIDSKLCFMISLCICLVMSTAWLFKHCLL